jgi:plastocyanin
MSPTQIVRIVDAGGTWTYEPALVTIKPGMTVTWINETDQPHTVTSDNPAFANSGWFDPGASFSQTFDTAGDFSYYCWPHRNMVGGVNVAQ